jgi:hypothetical protein
MQRAITDLQQFIRTQIDPIPVGQFYQQVLKNPGKGVQRLSMKITAADVREFDPSKRKLKTMPPVRKGPQRVEAPGMQEAFEQDMGGGLEEAYDYEGLLYMADTAAGGLKDIAEALIRVQPNLEPQQQKEAGAIIAKLRAAIRALGA